MKLTLVTILLLIGSTLAQSAVIECGSVKASHKRTYPINDAAIAMAAKLGVKTCTGTSSQKFRVALKKGKHTGKFVVVSATDLQVAKDKLTAKGGAAGPWW